jgi:hypothetical protein
LHVDVVVVDLGAGDVEDRRRGVALGGQELGDGPEHRLLDDLHVPEGVCLLEELRWPVRGRELPQALPRAVLRGDDLARPLLDHLETVQDVGSPHGHRRRQLRPDAQHPPEPRPVHGPVDAAEPFLDR